MVNMVQRQIKLNETGDVKEFVSEASKCEFDIDVFYNRVIIDAKSILGVLSMDLTRVLTVRCNGHDERFDRFLDRYAIA
jgi:phosphocarrier protein HPr